MNLIVLIVTAIFLVLGIIQLFINFDISLLVTVILTVIVGVLYFRADKQAKEVETTKPAEITDGNIDAEPNEACVEDDGNDEQGRTTENS